MWKSGLVCVFLILLSGSGDGFTMKRGFEAEGTNNTGCKMPKQCEVYGFGDWFNVGKNCVKYFKQPLNFTQAEMTCRSKAPGAHLVSVHSSQENNDLLCIVKKFNPRNLRFWLGAFEFFKSGLFLWLDGSFWNYQIWTPGEPNHMYTNTEECVEMNWKCVGKWNDDNCYVKKNFICAFKKRHMLEKDWE